MERKIWMAGREWLFHSWKECSKQFPVIRFHDEVSAADWLSRFYADPMAMATLRSVASTSRIGIPLGSLADDELIRQIALFLHSGYLHAHSIPFRPVGQRVAGQPSANADPPPPAPAAPGAQNRSSASSASAAPPPPVAPADPDTFPSSIDGKTTAAALCSAADDGTPFCEECAKEAMASAGGR